jgi:SAM-dependent methyltransferase
MDKGYEKKYHEVEEKNWWFVSRRDAIVRLLETTPRDKKILDIGCAGGVLVKDLTDKGFTSVHGLDFSPEAVEQCKEKGLKHVVVGDAHATPFGTEEFDLLIASDSLEHLEHDEKALLEWKRILKKNGRLIIFVPAYNFLWSEHDEVNHHFRRYSKADLRRKLLASGFQIERISFWNFFLFFPTALVRIVSGMFRKRNTGATTDHVVKLNPAINRVFCTLFRIENIFFKIAGLPVGVSVFASAVNK